MNNKRLSGIAALTVVGALVLSACAAGDDTGGGTTPPIDSALSGELAGIGASAQGAAQDAWQAGFIDIQPGVIVNYDGGGSGAGREGFIAGAAQFAGSDRAFRVNEIAENTFAGCVPDTGIIQLPLYISPIAIAFNLPGVDSLNLDAETIAKIFRGEITKWNDVAIASQNEGANLPSAGITYVRRADNSGTTENFTDYLSKAAPAVWTDAPHGDWPSTGGEAVQGTGGIADALANTEGTIGYLDASRAGDLSKVNVKVGEEYVELTAAAAAKVVEASPYESGRTAGDLAVSLQRDTTESGAYPIVLISYLIGCEQYQDANTAAMIKAYFTYAASAEGQLAAETGAKSAPISDALRADVNAAIALIK